MAYTKPGSPFLFDETTNDIVGFKDRDTSEVLLSSVSGGGIAVAPEWQMLSHPLRFASSIPNFGSSAADTTKTRSATNTLYFDPLNGSDAANGSTYLLAKKTLPTSAAANTKYMIAAGRTIKFAGTPGTAFLIAQPGVVLSCYDPLTGNEVLDQPNPYVRAMLGGWVTAAEKATKYWTLEGDSAANGAYGGTGGKGIGAANSNQPLIRGCVIRDWGYAAVTGVNNNPYRIEDCVVEDNARVPSASNSYFGGSGLRFEGATPSGQGEVVRCFISGSGEDAIWAAGPAVGLQIRDNAIRHYATTKLYNQQHSDVLQCGGYPGAILLRRNVIEHKVAKASLIDTGSGAVNIGALMIWTGAGSDTPGGAIEDNILASDNIVFNLQGQSGYTKTRNVGYCQMGVNSLQTSAYAMLVETANSTETDCVWVYQGQPANYGIRGGAGVAAKTRVSEFLG